MVTRAQRTADFPACDGYIVWFLSLCVVIPRKTKCGNIAMNGHRLRNEADDDANHTFPSARHQCANAPQLTVLAA